MFPARSFIGIVLAGVLSCAPGCTQKSKYERLVERELDSGVVTNTIFLGYEFGMPRDTFYDHSWDLNRQGLVMQGPRNLTVQYELGDDLPYEAKMFYYPDFFEERIYQMRVRFLYDGWAPWNHRLASDSLQLDVLKLFSHWYGDGFFEYARTQEGFGVNVQYVKIDGTRRIMIGRESASEVVAVFTDIIAERKIKELQARADDV